MTSDMGIPDGEYELELSDILSGQLAAQDQSSKAPVRSNDEILSIKYAFRPDSIDDTKPVELIRDESGTKAGVGFQLKSQSTEHEHGIDFQGLAQKPRDLECLLVYNPNTKSFELQKLDYQLRTNSSRNNKLHPPSKKPNEHTPVPEQPKPMSSGNISSSVPSSSGSQSTNATSTTSQSTSNQQQQQKQAPAQRRRPKEPSVFQPKARPKTPIPRPASTSTNKPAQRSSTPTAIDDEVPLSKLSSPKKSSSLSNVSSLNHKKPSTHSSLPSKKIENIESSPITSPQRSNKSSGLTNSSVTQKRSKSPSPIDSKKKEQSKPLNTKSNNSQSKNSTPQPSLQRPGSTPSLLTTKPLPNQVSSKKPPSAVPTPTIQQDEPSDDDEFGSLVDELEEELISDEDEDEGLITIEDGNSKLNQVSKPSYDFGVKNGSGPRSFRDIAGVNSKDEDDLSSSEEE